MKNIELMKNFLTLGSKNIVLMMSLFLSLAVITSCGDDEEPPVVQPTPDPSVVLASFTSQVDADNSLTYNFTNNSVVNGITDRSFSSSWDFGGNGSSTDESPSFTFSEEGSFTVTLTVTAADGEVGTASETIEVTAPRNRFAVITDGQDDDTGELRLAVDSIQNGRISFVYRVTAGPSDDIQDGFINVTGSSTSGRNSIVEIRLKDNAPHEFREGASDATIAAGVFPEGVPDVWIPVEISWTSDQVGVPLYTVIIDGSTVITDAPSTTRDPNNEEQVAEHLGTVIDGARNFQWKYASNSTVSDGFYQVDEIQIFSSDSGSEVIVFEDNFQGRVVGDILDPDVDESSPYHANTTDATVGEE